MGGVERDSGVRVMVIHNGCEGELIEEGGAPTVGRLIFQPCWVKAIYVSADEDVIEVG